MEFSSLTVPIDSKSPTESVNQLDTAIQELTIGFIILRHVNNSESNKYWKLCYTSIRKFYPENLILLIDDNSNYNILDKKYEKQLYKTTIIRSKYKQRGELLPYYYYLLNKLFDIAVIIHDSAFINKKLDFSVKTYKLIWEFEHKWDQIKDEINMIKYLNNNKELLNFYSKKRLWKGCYGGMCIITHDYLKKINDKYDLSKLLPYITNRYRRKSFERVIACILQKNDKKTCLLGNIHKYCRWGIKYKDKNKYNKLPIIKIWSGR